MDIKELNLNEEQLTAVNKLLQSEGDRVRTEYSTKLKEVNGELEKYRPKEKSDAEKDFEQRLLSLEQKEKELTQMETKTKLKNKFAEKGLPSELSDFISVGDEQLDEVVDKLSNTLGNHYLQQGYKPQSHAKKEVVTKEQYKNMSYLERVKLEKENPELIKQFRG